MNAATAGIRCHSDTLCIETTQGPGYVELRGNSRAATPITVKLTPTLSNMTMDGPAGGHVLQPGESAPLVRLRVADPERPSSYRYQVSWARGDYRAVHDDDHVYGLPYQPGAAFLVTQGYNGEFSHNGDSQFAVDFKMSEGTPIFAAREGRVVGVRADSTVGGPDRAYEDAANYVVIEHADGTYGEYLHLQAHQVRVREGDRVRQGQLIGLSGNTGFSSGPHLHFMVAGATADAGRRSFPVRFLTSGGIVAELQRGGRYRYDDILPADGNGVGTEGLAVGGPAADAATPLPAAVDAEQEAPMAGAGG